MIEMIRRLEERGIAYRRKAEPVNFSVRKFPGYGKLSGKSLEDLRAGERVEVDTTKRDHSISSCGSAPREGEPFLAVALGQWGAGFRAGTSSVRR